MERKQNNIETDDLEHQIDMMVYELYGLSQKEIDLLRHDADYAGKLGALRDVIDSVQFILDEVDR